MNPTKPRGSTVQNAPEWERGALEPGNINLWTRPAVRNQDGTISSVRSISVGFGDKTYLLPSVAHDGARILSTPEAIDQFRKSGLHLGIFPNPEMADRAAEALHRQQEALKIQNTTAPDPRLLALLMSVKR